jgi:DNA-binding CsgD family transcriptional regulator
MDAVLERLADPAARAVVKLRLTSFLAWGSGSLEEAAQVGRAAARLFERAGDQRGRLFAEHELAWVRGLGGDLEAMLEEVARIAGEAEACGDDVLMRRTARTLMIAAIFCGHFDDYDARIGQSIELARRAQDRYGLLTILVAHAQALALEGRVNQAWEPLRQAAAIDLGAREYGLLEYSCAVHWASGDFRTAVSVAQRALGLVPGVVARRRGFGIACAALAAAETDQPGVAGRIMERLRPTYAGGDWMPFSAWAAHVDAVLRWRADPTPAAAASRRAADRMLAARVLPQAAITLVDLAELAGMGGDPAVSGRAAADLDEIAAELDRDLHHGLAGIAAAWAALAAGDAGRAAARAERAVELLEGLGYQAFRGWALDVLARAVAGRDRQRAVELLTSAAETFEGCGAVWRRRRTLERLRALGPRGRGAADALSGPSSLTAREREVARLAVYGLTSREIGERLFIAERTVEGHLARIYAKLGIASKVQLAARAGDFGLDGG